MAAADEGAPVVGYVLRSDADNPTNYEMVVAPGEELQMDDIVHLKMTRPDGTPVTIWGTVDRLQMEYEGIDYPSDVVLAVHGSIPVRPVAVAHVRATRVYPDRLVPPPPGTPVLRSQGLEREKALFYDEMERRFPLGLDRTGHIAWGNLRYLDGTRGAHFNIAGISGVATKTSYALFLLNALLRHPDLSWEMRDARAIIFNLKGEDLMYLDKPNVALPKEDRAVYEAMGLPAEPFADVAFWAPPRRDSWDHELLPAGSGRRDDIVPLAWSVRAFCQEGLLPYLFGNADRETGQLQLAIATAEERLRRDTENAPSHQAWVTLDGSRITSFEDLVEHLEKQDPGPSHVAWGTYRSFLRRLRGAARAMGHMVRGGLSPEDEARHRFDLSRARVHVVDIHALPDQAQRFVVGVVLQQVLRQKDELGQRQPLLFVVLDELNKYAPREGWSPIKETVMDIAERGRSLGIILIGAQQMASDVEPRVVVNASFRAAGRLDAAEAGRPAYDWLRGARARIDLLRPGALFVSQPELPAPVQVRFPHPAWATRFEELQDRRAWRDLFR